MAIRQHNIHLKERLNVLEIMKRIEGRRRNLTDHSQRLEHDM